MYSETVAINMGRMTRYKKATGTFNKSFKAVKVDKYAFKVGSSKSILQRNPVFISKLSDGDYSGFIVANEAHRISTKSGKRVLVPTSGIDNSPLQVAKATGKIKEYI